MGRDGDGRGWEVEERGEERGEELRVRKLRLAFYSFRPNADHWVGRS
jgi:hypothetical protein